MKKQAKRRARRAAGRARRSSVGQARNGRQGMSGMPTERVSLEDEHALGGYLAPQPVRAHELVVRRVGQVVNLQKKKTAAPRRKNTGGGIGVGQAGPPILKLLLTLCFRSLLLDDVWLERADDRE